MIYKWNYEPQPAEEVAEATHLANELGIHPVFGRMLRERCIFSAGEARRFFRPQLTELLDPFLMNDMQAAVERLNRALLRKERIMVYGDYDVDGVTSVALVYKFISQYYPNIDYYIPDRYEEGYGVSKKGVDFAAESGVRLIIVLLGANDPQDTPNPAAPEQKLNFGTPEWENYYRGEIRKILQTAAARGAKTLWIGPPLMKAPKYSKKITYLDGLIADEVEKAQQHYQNTNRLFAKADGSYTAFLPDERGKPVAVRKGDGIHFTGPGEKILTRHIIEQINP